LRYTTTTTTYREKRGTNKEQWAVGKDMNVPYAGYYFTRRNHINRDSYEGNPEVKKRSRRKGNAIASLR